MGRRIVLATENDREEILSLYRSFIGEAADWTEEYPSMDTINFDLDRDALYVMKNDADEIIAAISIDDDEEVNKLTMWSPNLQPSAEIARICVRKDMQNQGIVKEMVRFIFDILRSRGMKSIHILVKTGHVVALSAYGSLGFKEVGFCNMFGKDFICMEIPL